MRDADVIVIGAGPGGLAAATAAGEKGARVLLLERDAIVGGILNQCIHDGFGLVRYKEQLSGPEYAARSAEEAVSGNVTILTDVMVTSLGARSEDIVVETTARDGIRKFRCGAVVLATGCRERTRGMIRIPGSRPAGIYTAGVAQNLINRRNAMVGKNVVILGTGDIGLIMARRLTLEGANVICAIEMMPDVCGLSRNVRQCLQDYDIPVYLSHTVTDIIGKNRLEAVIMSEVDASGVPISGTEQRIGCDTLILSVGVIPENEVAQTAGIALDPATNGILTDVFLMTKVPGIFACGNCKTVMDLADYVSEEGTVAGRNAAAFVRGEEPEVSCVCGVNTSPKGMPEDGVITCTFCPKGCTLKVDQHGAVTGNGCDRGLKFAELERTDPHRILTTTVRAEGADTLVPVRSDGYVPLREMRQLVASLRGVRVKLPVRAGDVIVSGVGSDAVNIVAQCDAE